MVLSSNKAFSHAAHEVRSDGQVVDWVTGPVNVVLQDNGVVDVFLGKDNRNLITLDTQAGLLQVNNTTTPMQWSNSDAEIDAFIDRARTTYSFGRPLASGDLDVRHNGSSNFIRIGDSAILISELHDKSVGVAIFDEGKGIRSVQSEPLVAVAPPAPRRDIDNVLAHASI